MNMNAEATNLAHSEDGWTTVIHRKKTRSTKQTAMKPKERSGKSKGKAMKGQRKIFPFMELPFELPELIYRILFVLPIGVRPCDVIHRRRNRDKNSREQYERYRKYQYQYDGLVQKSWNCSTLPSYSGYSASVLVAQTFSPGCFTDPTQENTARVLHRSDVPDQIITFDTGTFCGFAGVRIFRTCRQISTEARFIFYSENLWVFAPMHLLPCHILEKQCHFIPWLGREGSSHATKAQKRKRVANLFTPNADRTAFFRQDPLSRFCRTIGRENLSLITKIKIEGSFSGGRNRGRARLGVGSVLPVYTAILDQVCPNLRKIFLSRVDFLSTGIEVETDPIILDGKTEAQYIGGILSTVVSELPQLLELQLGHYVCTVGLGAPYEVPFPPMALDGIFFEDEWKHARGAQKIVEDRKRQREHTSLQDYRKKAATQAREALQKTCGSSIVYG